MPWPAIRFTSMTLRHKAGDALVFRDEYDLEDWVVAEAKRLWGVEGLKFTPRGDTGWPDRIFFIPGGLPLLIEFKQPGESLKKRQAYVHRFLKRNGYKVETHDQAHLAIKAIARAMGSAAVHEKGREVPDKPGVRRSVP